jgi:hypothetical protein
MPQLQLGYLAALALIYTAGFCGLQRSPLMPGPRIFLQLAGSALIAAALLRHVGPQ